MDLFYWYLREERKVKRKKIRNEKQETTLRLLEE
jgi:hypothetical protein